MSLIYTTPEKVEKYFSESEIPLILHVECGSAPPRFTVTTHEYKILIALTLMPIALIAVGFVLWVLFAVGIVQASDWHKSWECKELLGNGTFILHANGPIAYGKITEGMIEVGGGRISTSHTVTGLAERHWGWDCDESGTDCIY